MPKSPNQKKKLLLILQFLEEKSDEDNPVALVDILSHLESYGITAERKSIYSDLYTLEEMGYDIISEKGRGYYLGSRDFELAELKLLCDAVAASKFITHKKSNALIEKLKKLTSESRAKTLRRQVVVAKRIKTMNESVFYSIDDIHRAIAEKRRITFKYFDINEKKEKVYHKNGENYTVSPLALLWDDENYYLVAFEEESRIKKHFRTDKMEKIKLLEEKISPSIEKDFNVEEYSQKLFGMYNGNEEAVWLCCENSFAGRIVDRFGSNLSFIPYDKNRFKVRVKVNVSPLFYSWIVGMNGKITILEPAEIVADFKNTLTKIARIEP